jgi:hypothetical protein
MLQVNRAFSFDRTPTSVRLKRAVSSMISPLSSNVAHNNCSTPISEQVHAGATPSSVMQNLRLASCTNLMNALESPKSSRPMTSRRSISSSSSNGSHIADSPQVMMPPPSMPPLHLSGFCLSSLFSFPSRSFFNHNYYDQFQKIPMR